MTIILDSREYLDRMFPSSQSLGLFWDTTGRYFVLLSFDAGIKLKTWYMLDKLSITEFDIQTQKTGFPRH